jgi:predicted TIM-barrel fold metal-dependent hydrolase
MEDRSQHEEYRDVKIVDAHHHIWDLKANNYPWLHDPKTPRVYGDHSRICRDYLITDYLRDMANQDIVKSVHVQADSDFADPVRETRWLQSIADDPASPRGFPNAIVAFADFSRDDIEAVLEDHCRQPNMRGIRQALNGIVTNPARHPDVLSDEKWQTNIGLLKRYNLSFDLQLFASQMESAAALVARHPDIRFVLLHEGLPMDQSPEGLADWKRGMQCLAQHPNIAVKISGFGMFDHNWTAESIRPLVLTTLELFGVDRAMFGSNFPVDGMWGTFDGIWDAYKAIAADFSEGEREKLFHDNAIRFYRIE